MGGVLAWVRCERPAIIVLPASVRPYVHTCDEHRPDYEEDYTIKAIPPPVTTLAAMTARYGTCSTGAKSRPRGGSFSTSIWSTPSAKRIASSTSCSRFPTIRRKTTPWTHAGRRGPNDDGSDLRRLLPDRGAWTGCEIGSWTHRPLSSLLPSSLGRALSLPAMAALLSRGNRLRPSGRCGCGSKNSSLK